MPLLIAISLHLKPDQILQIPFLFTTLFLYGPSKLHAVFKDNLVSHNSTGLSSGGTVQKSINISVRIFLRTYSIQHNWYIFVFQCAFSHTFYLLLGDSNKPKKWKFFIVFFTYCIISWGFFLMEANFYSLPNELTDESFFLCLSLVTWTRLFLMLLLN